MTEQLTETPADNGIADELLQADQPETEAKQEEIAQETVKEPVQEKEKFVPHAAFHEERMRRKEEQKLRQESDKRYQEELTKLTTRLEKLNNVILGGGEQELDPIEALKGEIAELKRSKQGDEEQRRTFEEKQREHHDFVRRYTASAEAYKKDNPEFPQAYSFLINNERDAFAKIYRDPAKLQAKLEEFERDLVNNAYDAEENPAQVIFELAQKRGYKKTESNASNKVEQMDKGLKAAKTLGSGGGKTESGGLPDLSTLGTISDEEFDRIFKQFEKQAKR